jgi:hypothetical protein
MCKALKAVNIWIALPLFVACTNRVALAETAIEAVNRIDRTLQSGHISYELTGSGSTAASSWKISFDYGRNSMREECTSSDVQKNVFRITQSGVVETTSLGISEIRPAPPRLSPLGRMEGYIGTLPGPI